MRERERNTEREREMLREREREREGGTERERETDDRAALEQSQIQRNLRDISGRESDD